MLKKPGFNVKDCLSSGRQPEGCWGQLKYTMHDVNKPVLLENHAMFTLKITTSSSC